MTVLILHEVLDETTDGLLTKELSRGVYMDFLPNPGENIYFTESEFVTVSGRYWDENGRTVLQTEMFVDSEGIYIPMLLENGWEITS